MGFGFMSLYRVVSVMPTETVLVAGFAHETNTFSQTPTDRQAFQDRQEYVGEEVARELTGTNTAIGGIIDVAETEGIDLCHTVAAAAMPAGRVTADAYTFYAEAILDGVRDHRDELDGVILALHGAMVPEAMDDGEGPLLTAVREVVGSDVPIVATLDLHANISDEMLASSTALVAFESYPHVDMGETGRNGMHLLIDAMRGQRAPTMAIERPPVLPYGPTQNTREGPMAEVMAHARELEQREGILKVNVFPGFAQADIPSMGFSIPVVADGDTALAADVARELAQIVWEMRDEFISDYPTPAEAVADALEITATLAPDDGPVVLADTGDNPGGGGATDGTTVLRELLTQGATNAGFAIMCDPEAVAACLDAGVGERVTVTLGGKTDDLHGEPIEDIDGYVKVITDGEFRNTGPMGTGTRNTLGRTVLFQCGVDDGVNLILTELRVQPLDAEIWRHVGIQPERLEILVVKSTNHYRADYEPLSSAVISVDSPGLIAIDPTRFTFEHIRRPMVPLDEMGDDDYAPS